jgi:hypothetical protein
MEGRNKKDRGERSGSPMRKEVRHGARPVEGAHMGRDARADKTAKRQCFVF